MERMGEVMSNDLRVNALLFLPKEGASSYRGRSRAIVPVIPAP
jgi:hypothetical protein